ncbi:hypothetical protein V1477_014691 [Vespula maculifrons]|uniref:Uncharacterized protein n=1 Tax=Vespula maculifrons TaxID=7453 RepID=A0ABD2BIH6_VESMC
MDVHWLIRIALDLIPNNRPYSNRKMIGMIQRQPGPHITGLKTGEQANVYNLLQGRYVILEILRMS